MEKYGYLYNKFSKDIKQFSKNNTSIKTTQEKNYTSHFLIGCVLLFIFLIKQC